MSNLTDEQKRANGRSASRAMDALNYRYNDTDQVGGINAAITDLLTDLRHLCVTYAGDVDFEDAIKKSQYHFDAEMRGEN